MGKKLNSKMLANGTEKLSLTFSGEAPDIEAQEGKPATFTMVLYAGGPIRPGGWPKQHPLVLDLSGMQVINDGRIPFNRGHQGDSALVGQGTAQVSATSIQVDDGVLSFNNKHTQEIISSSKAGFVWASSMEATLLSVPKFIPTGKRVTVNGRQIAGPVYVARRSELFAGAFIGSNPADKTTSVSIAAMEHDMPKKLKEWLVSRGVECETLTEDEIKAWQSDYDVIHASEETLEISKEDKKEDEKEVIQAKGGDGSSESDDVVQEIRAKAAAEHVRITAISKLCGDSYPEIVAQAVAEGWDESKVELAVVKAKHAELQKVVDESPTGPAIHSSSSEELMNTNVYAAALHQSMDPRMRDSDFVAEVYGEKEVALAKKLPKAAGLQYLCYAAIRAAGGHVEPGVGMTSDVWQQAIKSDRQLMMNADIQAASAFSTFSLTNALSNLAHKSLLRMYRDWPTLVTRICDTAEHTDFKEHTKVAVEGEVETLKLPPTGEIKHGTMSDTVYTNQIFTWARMLSITRQDFFNDDLNAFSRNGRELGRGAMRSREKLMWLTILDTALNGTFWNTAGAVINRITGAVALDVAGLEAADLLMKRMNDEQGEPILISPDACITGTTLSKTAENLLVRRTTAVSNANAAAGTPTTEFHVEDSWLGRFGHITTPYIDVRATMPGSSDSLWFLLGDKDYPAFEYAQLRGEGAPIIDTADTDFNTLGFQSRVYWDYGFKEQNPRGMIKIEL